MTTPVPKKKPRRWVKIIYLHLIADVSALLLLFAFLKWWFPAQFAIRQAEKFLRLSYGWDVKIQKASIDPFAHIYLDDLAISYAPNQPPVIHAKSVKLDYEVLPLIFRKELRIHNVLIDSPSLDLRTLPNGKWNLEALITPFITEDTSAVVLPFLLKLDQCDVLNAAIKMAEKTDTSQMNASFGTMNLHVRQFTGTSLDNFCGLITIDIPAGNLDFQMNGPIGAAVQAQLTTKSTIDIDSVNIHTQLESHLIPINQDISFQQWKPEHLPEISLSIDAMVDLLKKTLTTQSFILSVDPVEVCTQIDIDFGTNPTWSLQIEKPVSVELSEMMKIIKGLNLLTAAQFTQIPNLDGTVSLDSLKLSGSGFQPDSSNFAVNLSGKVSADVPEINITTPIKLQSVGFATTFDFAAEYSNNNLKLGSASITGGINEIKIDSLPIPVIINSLNWNSNINIADQGKTLHLQVHSGIGNLFDGTVDMTSQATIDLPIAMEQKPEALKSFALHITLSNLDLSPFGNGIWGGRISTEFQLNASGNGQINADGIFAMKSPWIIIEKVRRDFPDLYHHINLQAQANLKNQSIEIAPFTWEWSDVADASINLKLQLPNFHIDLLHSELDISKLKNYLPQDLLSQIDWESLSGFLKVSGEVEGSVNDILSSKVNLSGEVQKLSLQVNEPKTNLSNVTAKMQVEGGLESAKGSVSFSIDDGGITNDFPHLFENTYFHTYFQCDNMTTLFPPSIKEGTKSMTIQNSLCNLIIDSLSIGIPYLAFTGNSKANITLNQNIPSGKISFDLNITPKPNLTFWDTISYSGIADLKGDIILDSTQAIIDGEIRCTNVNANIGSLASLKGLNGRIPYSQTLNLKTGLPIIHVPASMAHRAMGLPSYSSLQSSYHWTMPTFGTLSVDSLEILGYGISSYSMDASWKDGNFEAPSFQCDAYGGDVHGNLSASVTGITPDSLKVRLQLDVAGIQSAQIVNTSTSNPEESIIAGNADITMQGIPTSPNFDVYGGADITRIGRSVASDLLQLMDPEGRDEGIQSTRRYLGQGWGVKVFSFKIRDGFVYSYIVPSAPPLSKLHMYFLSKIIQLPPQITYGRIPIKFFLK
jgi:hypothetical protein